MQSIGQISTQASHSMQSGAVNTVWMSQFRQRCDFAERQLDVVAKFDPARMSFSAITLSRCGTL